jgi:hypothetical protein
MLVALPRTAPPLPADAPEDGGHTVCVSSWIRYWSRPTVARAEGKPVAHVASEQFHDAGVEVDDEMFVVTYRDGVLHVVTSLRVAHVVNREEAEEILGHGDLWRARWHVIADPGTVRRATLSAVLSDEEAAGIVFIGRDGRRAPPARNRHGSIDPQTFRAVRRVDKSTAAMFRAVLQESDHPGNATS